MLDCATMRNNHDSHPFCQDVNESILLTPLLANKGSHLAGPNIVRALEKKIDPWLSVHRGETGEQSNKKGQQMRLHLISKPLFSTIVVLPPSRLQNVLLSTNYCSGWLGCPVIAPSVSTFIVVGRLEHLEKLVQIV